MTTTSNTSNQMKTCHYCGVLFSIEKVYICKHWEAGINKTGRGCKNTKAQCFWAHGKYDQLPPHRCASRPQIHAQKPEAKLEAKPKASVPKPKPSTSVSNAFAILAEQPKEQPKVVDEFPTIRSAASKPGNSGVWANSSSAVFVAPEGGVLLAPPKPPSPKEDRPRKVLWSDWSDDEESDGQDESDDGRDDYECDYEQWDDEEEVREMIDISSKKHLHKFITPAISADDIPFDIKNSQKFTRSVLLVSQM